MAGSHYEGNNAEHAVFGKTKSKTTNKSTGLFVCDSHYFGQRPKSSAITAAGVNGVRQSDACFDLLSCVSLFEKAAMAF